MSQSITILATNQYNERFAPAGAKKAYLARIDGRDKSTTFKREFLAKDSDFDAASCPVLLERRNVDKKGRPDEPDYILLLASGDDVVRCDIDKSDAMWLAAQLDAGRSLDSCWDADGGRVTPAAAEKATVAATIDAATEECWRLIQAMPLKDAKKVLDVLRKRVTPPKPPAAVGMTEDAPAGVVADANMDAGVSEQQMGLTPTPVQESDTP